MQVKYQLSTCWSCSVVFTSFWPQVMEPTATTAGYQRSWFVIIVCRTVVGTHNITFWNYHSDLQMKYFVKLVCADWVYPFGTCVVFCFQGINMLFIFEIILQSAMILLWSVLTDVLILYTPRQCCKVSNFKSGPLCLPIQLFLFWSLLSPLTSSYYSRLASCRVLNIFFGSCRICHCEGDDESPLITPCHCTGSLRFVHQSCLQQWIKSSDTRCCELCKYEFIMETKLKPLRKVKQILICI